MSIKFGDFAASDELFTHRLRPAEQTQKPDTEFFGDLRYWNADRWFGFIERDDDQPAIFVHGSRFESAGIEPAIGMRLTFTIQIAPDGRRRVDRLRRADPEAGG